MPKAQTAEVLATLIDMVKDIGNKFEGFDKRLTTLEIPKERVLEAKTEAVTAPVTYDSEPIPTDIREAVDLILNKEFEVRINSQPGAFQLHVLVPKKYSNASPAHWEQYKEDDHAVVIERHKGLEGVKEWLNRVFNNLGQDARTQIVIERNKTSGN
jgi:hypothetical protein